ncbi:hypothetical protein Hanom_Chr10g00922191 [Helianthus anomalus]
MLFVSLFAWFLVFLYIGLLMMVLLNNCTSELQKSFFMLILDCKVCPLSSKITKNVLHVCKPLHIMSFNPNSVSFFG